MSIGSVNDICSKTENFPNLNKFNFQDDFTPPVCNVWKLQNKSNKSSHFGNTEQRWLENLLMIFYRKSHGGTFYKI